MSAAGAFGPKNRLLMMCLEESLQGVSGRGFWTENRLLMMRLEESAAGVVPMWHHKIWLYCQVLSLKYVIFLSKILEGDKLF